MPKPMILRWMGVLPVLLLLFSARPMRAWGGGEKQDRVREVAQLEREWRSAELAGDVGTMDHLLSDDYVSVTMQGKVHTKSQQLRRMRERMLVLNRMELRDVKIRVVGQVAVVTGRASILGQSSGVSLDGTYRYTQILHRSAQGTWTITNFEAIRSSMSAPVQLAAVQADGGRS